MAFTTEDRSKDLLAYVHQHIDEKFSPDEAALIHTFTQQFYADVAEEDINEHHAIDLYGIAITYWNFITADATTTDMKIRVYNPQFEQHHWQSTHSIVSIIVQDMPFLVDSVRMTLNNHGLSVHSIIHPVMHFQRNEAGMITGISSEDEESDATISREALLHVEVDRQTEQEVIDAVYDKLKNALHDLKTCVDDWQPMHDRMDSLLVELQETPPPLAKSEVKETYAFLRWLEHHHFTFLGYREYSLDTECGEDVLNVVAGTGLGILRDSQKLSSTSFNQLPIHLRGLARDPSLLLLTKTNSRSTIHRATYMDYVGVKKFDAEGNVIGERRFLGLYTSAAYHNSVLEIPLLRQKMRFVMDRVGYRKGSHRSQALLNILETYPRDELFQIDTSILLENALGILRLRERQQVRLFIRPDTYGRFFSCIVYVPRDHYTTEVRKRIQHLLLEAFNGESIEFTVQLSEALLAQVHFVVRTALGSQLQCDIQELESRLNEITRDWLDRLDENLLEHCGEERGSALFRRYQDAFPLAYREDFLPRYAVYDIDKMEALAEGRDLGMTLYQPIEADHHCLRFKLFHSHRHLPLSNLLPILENMGVEVISERSYEIKPQRQINLWIQEFELSYQTPDSVNTEILQDSFKHLFSRVWRGEIENDGFNRLVLYAQLTWREIVIFRAYYKYLRQVGNNFSQVYMEQVLASNPAITCLLLNLFMMRHDPLSTHTDTDQQTLLDEIYQHLDSVNSLDEDRILRLFLGLILATLRTNYFQKEASGESKNYVSFKFDPHRVPDMPDPCPMYEIFVYSPCVEGVHLRGGKVARGGLRWSDRLEDFRTEVLGLVKAQLVKNALIVPVGSKGGFVAKCLPTEGGREAIQKEGIACYKIFIRGLLDVTDNLVDNAIVPPVDVVRHDEDDPYLVVAADKGTATFSDIANGIAQEYNFWLGDAFASGGSAGYDHKKMGITARGAWESVKMHFRSLGLNTQTDDFNVIGIGDMSGDVFGNGMLLSSHIKLVGAFNHLHIFLDPNPDPEKSFAERQRLFNLPRSTWADYDMRLVSKGGGIFARNRKSIPLSPEIQTLLGTDATALPPNELIQAMLRAPIDLLWNGGIGTYVKASHEHHADVGDRANDGLRIDANTLRCRVIGEGGNLGFTQAGRIEYALNKGLINTDAIDNAGGVNCSDHEVNIKILLNHIVRNGDMTDKQRNKLLINMTERVSDAVIMHNYLQTQVLILSLSLAPQLLDVHLRFIRHLESTGKLDRELEFLPSDKVIAERRAQLQGLAAPEMSVLLAYSKITLYDELLASDLPEDEYLEQVLMTYFPSPLPEKFSTEIKAHRLRREIVATSLTNMTINRAGLIFLFNLQEDTGLGAADIIRAFVCAWDIFDMESLWKAVEDLDNKVDSRVQIQMMIELQKLLERASRWLLRNQRHPLNIAKTVTAFKSGVQQLSDSLCELIDETDRHSFKESTDNLTKEGVPAPLATHIAGLVAWLSALDIVDVAQKTNMSLAHVAGVHFGLGTCLKLHWLRDRISTLPRDNRWNALSRSSLRDDLYRTHRNLTMDIMQTHAELDSVEAQINQWITEREHHVNRCEKVLLELGHVDTADLAMLSVGVREVKNLLS